MPVSVKKRSLGGGGLVTSVNGLIGAVVITGNNGAKTCHVVGTGGNDATGEIGNILRPFETHQAAINVSRLVPGSLIVTYPGSYTLNDANCPYGLMYPGASYDLYFHANAIINYYGTYGLFISDTSTFGNVFGFGQFYAFASTFSGSVNGVNNFAINVGISSTRKQFNGTRFISESSTSTANGIRCGACTATSFTLHIDGPVVSRGGRSMLLDTGCRFLMSSRTDIQNTSQNSEVLKIVAPITIELKYFVLVSYAYSFGRTQATGITIENPGTGVILIQNMRIYANVDAANYRLINFVLPADSVLNNVLFANCTLSNRFDSATAIQGKSIYSSHNLSIKGIDTYVNANLDAAAGKSITNLISTGTGIILEPNL